jgi:hypothetical protein
MAKRTLNDVINDDEANGAVSGKSVDFEKMRQQVAEAKANQAEHDEDSAGPEASAPRSAYSATKKFDAAETSLPRLSLAQGLSPEVRDRTAQVGDFLLPGFEPEQSVILVVAGHTTQRRYVPQGEQRAKCWSPDGIACAECPLSQWMPSEKVGPDGRRKNTPPPCNEIDSWACFSVTHGMPVTWPLKGTAMRASRFIKTLANGYGMGAFAVEVKAVTKTAPGRNWVEPDVRLYRELGADECLGYAKIAHQAVGITEALAPTTAELNEETY